MLLGSQLYGSLSLVLGGICDTQDLIKFSGSMTHFGRDTHELSHKKLWDSLICPYPPWQTLTFDHGAYLSETCFEFGRLEMAPLPDPFRRRLYGQMLCRQQVANWGSHGL